MVYFSSQPEDLTPIERGVVFVVESVEQSDFAIDIIDYNTSNVVASKIIKGVESAQVDIAPYINVERVTPSWSNISSLEDVPTATYYLTARTEMGYDESDPVRVCSNGSKMVVGSIYSVMAKQREICYGECDDVVFVAEPNSTVEARILASNGEQKVLAISSSTGVVRLHIATAQFSEHIKSFDVEIALDDNVTQTLHYTIVPGYKDSVRAVWISAEGMPERYTFPITLCKSVVAERKTLFTNRVVGDVVSSKSKKRISLRSRALTNQMAEGLSTIVTAPKVWLEIGGSIVEARVVESEMVTYSYGCCASGEFTFEYDGEEVVL